MGPFLNRDHYSTFVALALPIGLAGVLRHPQRRWWFTIASATLYASVIAGGSRAGFILRDAAELFLMFFLVQLSGRLLVCILSVMLVFGTVVGWGFLFGRFNEHDPYGGRREVAASTWQMVKASPAHGFGLGTWSAVYPSLCGEGFRRLYERRT